MIAGRRVRKRTLIRTDAMTSVIARTLSAADGVIRRNSDQRSARRGGSVSYSSATSAGQEHSMPPTPYDSASSQLDMMRYLRQLSALHDAGVLTDDEFSAAKGRLFGS